MEKVRPWCGQPSDRGRLKNRTIGLRMSNHSSLYSQFLNNGLLVSFSLSSFLCLLLLLPSSPCSLNPSFDYPRFLDSRPNKIRPTVLFKSNPVQLVPAIPAVRGLAII